MAGMFEPKEASTGYFLVSVRTYVRSSSHWYIGHYAMTHPDKGKTSKDILFDPSDKGKTRKDLFFDSSTSKFCQRRAFKDRSTL